MYVFFITYAPSENSTIFRPRNALTISALQKRPKGRAKEPLSARERAHFAPQNGNYRKPPLQGPENSVYSVSKRTRKKGKAKKLLL